MIAGLAHTSPSYLSIHPEHGPWIGLRAVIVLDADCALDEPIGLVNKLGEGFCCDRLHRMRISGTGGKLLLS